jgi:hypothetical protein
MSIKDLKTELVSKGIDCDSIIEKSELVHAVMKSRTDTSVAESFKLSSEKVGTELPVVHQLVPRALKRKKEDPKDEDRNVKQKTNS